MLVPIWLIVLVLVLLLILVAIFIAFVTGRNPLPFPDFGSRIFVAPSPQAKQAVVDLLVQHGVRERFRFDTEAVARSIMWDGTIINTSSPEILTKLKSTTSAISLVAEDPEKSARVAAEFLEANGFQAEVVLNVEPGLPIVFVLTDALSGAAFNFRKHVIHMPRPK